MKKIIGLVAIIGTACFAQDLTNDARAKSIIAETVGVTNYIGIATTTSSTVGTPNISNEVWSIQRIIYDDSGNLVSVNNAYNTNYTGNVQLWKNAWTNRAAATYK